jgi:hypothetical protein
MSERHTYRILFAIAISVCDSREVRLKDSSKLKGISAAHRNYDEWFPFGSAYDEVGR